MRGRYVCIYVDTWAVKENGEKYNNYGYKESEWIDAKKELNELSTLYAYLCCVFPFKVKQAVNSDFSLFLFVLVHI